MRAISGAASPRARRRVVGLRGVTMPCSIISVKGRYGAWPSSLALWPARTRSPRASASASISWISRVLPTPASPETGVLDRPAQVGPLPLAPDERGLDRPDRAAGDLASPLRLVQPPAVGEPPQPVEPAVHEREGPGRGDRVPDGRRDQDLAAD